uniref:Uncharacterized protein n=1 Tax=Arundo donax TaxID=35708 RepID=A0A0A9C3J7_ARUDO
MVMQSLLSGLMLNHSACSILSTVLKRVMRLWSGVSIHWTPSYQAQDLH